MTDETHLSVESIASLIDGSLSPEDRAGAERHLAHCDDCREELAASTRAVAAATVTPARRIPWRLIAPLAAGIVLAVLLRPPGASDRVVESPERTPPLRDAAIVTVFPPAKTTLPSGALRFVWRSIESNIGYRVVVKDMSGAPVWSGDVADTVLMLPDTVRFREGASYIWRVDAERADGTTASSPETAFRIEPR